MPIVSPVLEYIEATSLTTYSAHWGYNNREAAPVAVAIGPSNRFHPAPIDRGQTALFEPGRQIDVGPVTPLSGGNLVWNLTGRTGTAATPTTPVQPILGTIEDLGDGLKRVYFGYKNTHKQRVRVPFGPLNHFAHEENAGQPFSFAPGEWLNLFSVDVPVESAAEWTLMGQVVSG